MQNTKRGAGEGCVPETMTGSLREKHRRGEGGESEGDTEETQRERRAVGGQGETASAMIDKIGRAHV